MMDNVRRQARKQRPGVHLLADWDQDTFTHVRVDTLGRVRELHGDKGHPHPLIAPGERRRYPHPVHTLGYPYAVSFEYQSLIVGLLTSKWWDHNNDVLAGGLEYPITDERFLSYPEMVAYYQAVAASVATLRPGLNDALKPFADRHGLSILPWGMGWLIQKATITANRPGVQFEPQHEVNLGVGYSEITPAFRRTPIDTRQDPAFDALLLYLLLSGAWRHEDARKVVSPVVSFDDPRTNHRVQWPEDVGRRVMRTKAALGASRKAGRPRSQSRWANEDVLFVLRERVGTVL